MEALQTTDEQLISKYREITTTKNQKTKIFKDLLNRKRGDRSSWQVSIKKYVMWRMMSGRNAFDIYDRDDLSQRCLCCFYKAVSEKFDLLRGVQFSTYMYTALEKTVNRVMVELRKKKRTIEIKVDIKGKEVSKRVNPHKFTDSLNAPAYDDSNISLEEMIQDKSEDIITDNEQHLADVIKVKCKQYLTPSQYEIFMNSDIYGIVSGKELAIKYNKSEPTISAIKKRKIARALRKVRKELKVEFNLAN